MRVLPRFDKGVPMSRAFCLGATLLLGYCLITIAVDWDEILTRSHLTHGTFDLKQALATLNKGTHPRLAVAIYFLASGVVSASILGFAALVTGFVRGRRARRSIAACSVGFTVLLLASPIHAPFALSWVSPGIAGIELATDEISRAFRDAITYVWSALFLTILPLIVSPKIGQPTKVATAALAVLVVTVSYLAHPARFGSRTTNELIVFTFAVLALLYLGNRTRHAVDSEVESRRRAEAASRQASEEKRRYAEQSQAAVQSLQAMTQRLAAMDKSRMEFLAGAAHDMRQPLQSTVLYADALYRTLKRQAANDETNGLPAIAGTLLDEARALGKAFDTILDYSQIESGNTRVDIRAHRLCDIITDIERRYVPQAQQRGLRMRLAAPPRDCIVMTDRDLAVRLLSNLLSNAIKYSGGSSGTRRRRGDHDIVVRTRVRGLLATVFVIDQGCGIPEDKQALIFEAGVQLKQLQCDGRDGFGLGLATVRGIVDRALRGHVVRLRSIVGHGTHVMVDFPISFVDFAVPDDEAEDSAVVQTRVDLMGAMVAIVEDDARLREAIVTVLRGAGAFVLEAGGLAEIVDRVSAADRYPDVLLTDYRLADNATGRDVIERVRAGCNGREVPAIVLTAYQTEAEAGIAGLPGVEIMRKVVNPRTLLRRLSAHYAVEASPLEDMQAPPVPSPPMTTPARAIS